MSHITEEQRYVIERMSNAGYSQRAIAVAIGKAASSVCRELKRNRDKRGPYKADQGQRICLTRKRKKPRRITFTDEMKARVAALIKRKFSPEQIVGRSRLEGIPCVSHETIYRWIWRTKKRGSSLYKHLRNRGRRYQKRGGDKSSRARMPGRVDISLRPEIVNRRERLGDLEIDLVIGAGHKGALITINDRVAGTVIIRKVENKEAHRVADAVIEALMPIKHLIHTITADNGKEFREHDRIARMLDIQFFFATPYHSWERGANENLNGLIRQYFPKKTPISSISDEYIIFVQNELNNRPRKRFGFRSPNEMFPSFLNKRGVAFKC